MLLFFGLCIVIIKERPPLLGNRFLAPRAIMSEITFLTELPNLTCCYVMMSPPSTFRFSCKPSEWLCCFSCGGGGGNLFAVSSFAHTPASRDSPSGAWIGTP